MLSVFDKCDIFCSRETWFAVQDLHVVNNLHSNFHGFGVSTTDYKDGLVSGHPPGGVAIFWRKHLDQYIKPIDLKCDWCTAIEFNTGSNTVVIINVYLPYQCPANEDNYIEKLGYIHAVIDELNTSCYVVGLFGDWNANIRDPVNSLFARHMIDFCHDNNYNISTRLMLPDDSYTHVSEAWGSVSWLDHIVSSSDFHDNITSIDIDYDCTDVDHIPVLANIALTDMPIVTDVVNCDSRSSKLNWDKLNDSERKRYCDLTSEQLSAISVPDAVHCTNVNCSDPVHIEETTRFYIAILGSLQDANEKLVLLYFNSLVMVGVGVTRTSQAGPTMSLIYTKIPGIWAKCGAMLGSLVKARYLSFIANRSQDVNMRFVTSNVMKTPCVKNLLPGN